MITIAHLLNSAPVREALDFGWNERPVYARLADGLHEIDAVEAVQIMTSMGAHDVIVIAVSGVASKEE